MKRALVVGCGVRVWQDVDAAMQLCTWDAYYVVKMAGIFWPHGFFYWITLHPEFMEGFIKKRCEQGLPDTYQIVAPLKEEVGRHSWIDVPGWRRVTYRWPGMNASGASGLFGVKSAIDDGADRVVLAGIPMTVEDAHFSRFDEKGNKQPWVNRDSFTLGWKNAEKHYKHNTRSLSGGWTEELLGVPTREWLGLD